MKMHSMVALLVAVAFCAAGQPAPRSPATVPARRAEGWWTDRHNAILERAREGDIELVFLGDSITAGWSPARLAAHWDDYRAANFGIPADRTEHVLWRITNGELDGIKPELIVLMIGTNNLKSGPVRMPPADVAEGVGRIIDVLLEKLVGHAHSALRDPAPQLRAQGRLRVRGATNPLLPELAAGPRVYLHGLRRTLSGPDGKVRSDLMPDSLHPNEAGFGIWAESIRHHRRRAHRPRRCRAAL